MKKVLLKDIVIPKGTIFHEAPRETKRHGDGHFSCDVGLSDNTFGHFTYYIDPDELVDYFADVKG